MAEGRNKHIAWAAACAGLVLPAALLRIVSRTVPGFADTYTDIVNPFMVGSIGRLSGLLPFSVFEILFVMLVLYGLFFVVLLLFVLGHFLPDAVRNKGREGEDNACFGRALSRLLFHLRTLLLIASLLFFLFEVSEDVYFSRTRFAVRYDLERSFYSNSELSDTCEYLVEEITAWAPYVRRNENGIMQVDGDLNNRIRTAMGALGEEYPELSGWYPRPKPVFLSRCLSRLDITGVYSMFTIEANYNRDIPPYNLPFTLGHELSHLKGFESEKEANFLGFLSCIRSFEPDLHYSGAMMGWVYCGNELIKRDRKKWKELSERIPENATLDLVNNNLYWDRYKGKASETMHDINDAYLKTEGLKEGYASYDLVTDMIVAWKLKEDAAGSS